MLLVWVRGVCWPIIKNSGGDGYPSSLYSELLFKNRLFLLGIVNIVVGRRQ